MLVRIERAPVRDKLERYLLCLAYVAPAVSSCSRVRIWGSFRHCGKATALVHSKTDPVASAVDRFR